MTRPQRVLCVFEDRAFEDVILPVVERVFADEGLAPPRVENPLLTHGCRWSALDAILGDHANDDDLILIGADTRSGTPAQKRGPLSSRVERRLMPDRVVYALPEPCAEGWMQADLSALKRGIEAELGVRVALPQDTGPYPRTEEQAKDRLASILNRTRVPILRGGLEFEPAVMGLAEFSSHSSLEYFVRDLRRWLQGASAP